PAIGGVAGKFAAAGGPGVRCGCGFCAGRPDEWNEHSETGVAGEHFVSTIAGVLSERVADDVAFWIERQAGGGRRGGERDAGAGAGPAGVERDSTGRGDDVVRSGRRRCGEGAGGREG